MKAKMPWKKDQELWKKINNIITSTSKKSENYDAKA